MVKSSNDRLSKYTFTFNKPPLHVPTNTVVDAPIAGNGDIGVLLSGKPEHLKIYISKNDFWQIKSCRNKGGIKSIGGIEIKSNALIDASYYAEQNIYNGMLSTEFCKNEFCLKTETYVDYIDHLVVTKVKNIGSMIDISIDLWVINHPHAQSQKGIDGTVTYITKMFDTQELPWPSKVAMTMRILEKQENNFKMMQDDEITIITSLYTNHDTEDYYTKSGQKIK